MFNNLIYKSLPYLFILIFIFFEFSPNYFFQVQLIKPFMFFTIIYCWIYNDHKKFSPFSILILTVIYDLLNGDIVGVTCLFFLFIQYSRRKLFSEFISDDYKELWMKFILSFTFYTSANLLAKLFLTTSTTSLKNLTISFIITIALFPLFFKIVNKLSYKFRSYNE